MQQFSLTGHFHFKQKNTTECNHSSVDFPKRPFGCEESDDPQASLPALLELNFSLLSRQPFQFQNKGIGVAVMKLLCLVYNHLSNHRVT